eukprot:2491219-Pyramimonas_sp.AAC.1
MFHLNELPKLSSTPLTCAGDMAAPFDSDLCRGAASLPDDPFRRQNPHIQDALGDSTWHVLPWPADREHVRRTTAPTSGSTTRNRRALNE